MSFKTIRKLSLREIQLIELDILTALHNICETHDLRYFLCGGTLIGAARHQGFIPWDDDIDVMMPRPDYDALLKLCSNNLPGYKNIQPDPNWFGGVLRLSDTRTCARYASRLFPQERLQECGISIDIFCIDGIPNSKLLQRLQTWLIKYLTKISVNPMTRTINFKGKSIFHKIFLVLFLPIRPILAHIPRRWISKLPHYAASLWNYEAARYRGVAITALGECEVMPAEIFDRQCLMEFEGQHFHVPIGWRIYLQQRYGDWETLPPPSERIAHDMEAWWKGVQPHSSPDKTA